MCGLVIILGTITAKEETIFKQMLEVGVLRGRDSTGVIKVSSQGVVETRKKAVHGADFIKLESPWISSGFNKVLIGHNRWATKGAINDRNAHPFSYGTIHGCHNGTLDRGYMLEKFHTYDVDSQALLANIAEFGFDAVYPKLAGAFTVPIYDEATKLFTMFRNDQRELAMCFSKDRKTVYMASEYTMLQWVLERNGVDTTHIVNLKDFIELTFDPFSAQPICNSMKLRNLEFAPKFVPYVYKPAAVTIKPAATKEEKKSPEPSATHKETKRTKPSGADTDDSESDGAPFDVDEVIELGSYLEKMDEVVCMDINNMPMTYRDWRNAEVSKFGCACCGMDVTPDTEFVWHHDGSNAYCDDCAPFADQI